MIKTIAFDADDTLWINETIFTSTREKIERIISAYETTKPLEDTLYETEIKNLKIFGYGIKGFILSTIETCIEITDGRISSEEIHQIVELGKEMLKHPVQILPYVENTLKTLKSNFQLMIITKGDLFDQESKIARSGLADYFNFIEVVSEKKPKNYRDTLRKYGIDTKEFLMIGNSLKSDILPISEIGGKAIHIPFHTTWEFEKVATPITVKQNYETLSSMKNLVKLIEQITK